MYSKFKLSHFSIYWCMSTSIVMFNFVSTMLSEFVEERLCIYLFFCRVGCESRKKCSGIERSCARRTRHMSVDDTIRCTQKLT